MSVADKRAEKDERRELSAEPCIPGELAVSDGNNSRTQTNCKC